ncbi:MAG TPA: hypothetical protein VK970_00955, partial [Candidatus Methylacidiphilales bacterium]|nr:hypothetical protein [Candidatus Methylacidiphilales bacterium]
MKPYIYLPQCLEAQLARVKPSRANPARQRTIPEIAAAMAGNGKASAERSGASSAASTTSRASTAARTAKTAPVASGTPTPAPLMYRASITIPQGDGSVLVKPGKVMHELTPAQAAQ